MYYQRIHNQYGGFVDLIRETYWKDGKTHKRTVSNITNLPEPLKQQIIRFFTSDTEAEPGLTGDAKAVKARRQPRDR